MKRGVLRFLLLIFGLTVFSPVANISAQVTVFELSLRAGVEQALRENLNLRSAFLTTRFDYLSIIQQRALLDPSLDFLISHTESRNPNFASYIPTPFIQRRTTSASLQVTKRIFTGANWNAGLFSNLSDSNIEIARNYSSYASFSITQPFLRNFGRRVTESDIYLATLTGRASQYELENDATQLVTTFQTTYWNLVYARKTLDVLQQAEAQAESLLAFTQTAVSLGLRPAIEILQARTGVLGRRREVRDQETAVRNGEDQLRYILHVTDQDELTRAIVPTDSIPFPEVELDEQRLFEEALRMRPDYRALRTSLDQNHLLVDVARNATRPVLDLTASYRLNGSGESLGGNFSDLTTGNAYGWGADLLFSYPLGNRVARTVLEKSAIELRRSQLTVKDLEESIRTDLRTAIRNVRVNREKIREMEVEVELNRQKLAQEEERYRNGLTTSYMVLTFQNELATVQNLYNQALVEYALSVVRLQQASGTLLRDLDIVIEGVRSQEPGAGSREK
ncbi:MAG: TolC family protein [Candidatus Latescibacterota bacterium]